MRFLPIQMDVKQLHGVTGVLLMAAARFPITIRGGRQLAKNLKAVTTAAKPLEAWEVVHIKVVKKARTHIGHIKNVNIVEKLSGMVRGMFQPVTLVTHQKYINTVGKLTDGEVLTHTKECIFVPVVKLRAVTKQHI